MAKKTQVQRLLEHFKAGGSITSLEAFNALGITQLSARITDLERLGHGVQRESITVFNRFGEEIKVIKYSMEV